MTRNAATHTATHCSSLQHTANDNGYDAFYLMDVI